MFGGSLENFSVFLRKCLIYQGKGVGGPLGLGSGSGPMVPGSRGTGSDKDRRAQSPGGQFLGPDFLSAWELGDRIEGDRRGSKGIEGDRGARAQTEICHYK
jgi:hypothetical protein